MPLDGGLQRVERPPQATPIRAVSLLRRFIRETAESLRMAQTEHPGFAVLYVLLTGLVALAVFAVSGSGGSGGTLLTRLAESPNVFVGVVLLGLMVGVVLNGLLNW